jgi:hypothetical protein
VTSDHLVDATITRAEGLLCGALRPGDGLRYVHLTNPERDDALLFVDGWT